MRKMMLEGINVMLLVLITLATLFSCTLDASAVKNASEREMSSRVARMIDETMAQMMDSSVAEFLTPEQVAELEGVKDSAQGLDGRSIVSRMLEEEQGEEVLTYSYTAITSDDVDEILASARPLVGEEEYGKLVQQANEIEARAMEAYERASRAMSGEQQKKFYKELQGLVTKAVVLLTAALVYALIPNVMVWGKVSAACVAAVCAGVHAPDASRRRFAGFPADVSFQRRLCGTCPFFCPVRPVCGCFLPADVRYIELLFLCQVRPAACTVS